LRLRLRKKAKKGRSLEAEKPQERKKSWLDWYPRLVFVFLAALFCSILHIYISLSPQPNFPTIEWKWVSPVFFFPNLTSFKNQSPVWQGCWRFFRSHSVPVSLPLLLPYLYV
jgi:hypothetical protein